MVAGKNECYPFTLSVKDGPARKALLDARNEMIGAGGASVAVAAAGGGSIGAGGKKKS